MSKAFFISLFFLLIPYADLYAQIDAVVIDSSLDKLYINYPICSGDEYCTGDTVAAVYYEGNTSLGVFGIRAIRQGVFAKTKPVYVVRAVVKDVAASETSEKSVFGLKLWIYSIEKHDADTIVYIKEFLKPSSECTLNVGSEKWYDIYDWVTISGRYKVRKATDNYKIGDVVSRHYFKEPSLVGGIFGSGNAGYYILSAIVRGIDTSDSQRLLLEFTGVNYNKYRNNIFRPSKSQMVTEYPDSMEYNYTTVHVNDLVWTKPYHWFKAGQYMHVNSGKKTPSSFGISRSGCFRFLLYDCEGRQYTPPVESQ